MLEQEALTTWKEIETDDAVDPAGKKFDPKLDPKTVAVVERRAE